MRKRISCILLALLLALPLCGTAFAADNDAVAEVVQKDNKVDIDLTEASDGKVKVTCHNLTAEQQYLVLMLKSDENGSYGDINENTIIYIDQGSADTNGDITFTVYPTALQTGTILICGQNANPDGTTSTQLVAAIIKGKLILGDANGDGEVDISDAVVMLQYVVKMETTNVAKMDVAAANVDGRDDVDISDIVLVLRTIVGDYVL